MGQKEYEGLLRIDVMFSQRGGMGREYGRDKSSPRVLRAPKTKITIGTKTSMTMIVRMKY
jgi:hypothetical protein